MVKGSGDPFDFEASIARSMREGSRREIGEEREEKGEEIKINKRSMQANTSIP